MSNSILIHHRVSRPDMVLGLVRVEGIVVQGAPPIISQALQHVLQQRSSGDLPPAEEARRQGGRTILRNGRYKPTGRGKPASEYLLRAATTGTFPQINGPVDANNLVSLKHCLAISLWDLDLAETSTFEFRLGRPTERYVFNASEQILELEDLVCGCGLSDSGASRPLVTPIKDSLATKLTPQTTRVAGCIYYPSTTAEDRSLLQAITEEFLRYLLACGPRAQGTSAVLGTGQEAWL